MIEREGVICGPGPFQTPISIGLSMRYENVQENIQFSAFTIQSKIGNIAQGHPFMSSPGMKWYSFTTNVWVHVCLSEWVSEWVSE